MRVSKLLSNVGLEKKEKVVFRLQGEKKVLDFQRR